MPPDTAPLAIVAMARDDERDLMLATANRLSLCLGDGDRSHPIALRLARPGATVAPGSAAALIVSLRSDEEDFDPNLATRWLERLAGWRDRAVLANVFRHVADVERRAALAPHLRRLNLLAIELSRATGAVVADIDRAFALIGGRTLRTDHRCAGAMAIEVAAHAIVAGILATSLDGAVDAARIEAARVRNGGTDAIAAIVARHERMAA